MLQCVYLDPTVKGAGAQKTPDEKNKSLSSAGKPANRCYLVNAALANQPEVWLGLPIVINFLVVMPLLLMDGLLKEMLQDGIHASCRVGVATSQRGTKRNTVF